MSNKQLTVGVAVVAGIAVAALFFIGMNPFTALSPGLTPEGGLIVQDVVVGTGASAAPGDVLVVHYVGQLEDGTTFDSTQGRQPFTFRLGAGDVIAGWEQGLLGMQAGGRRLLVIPASLAYGAQGYGPIPPNATLIFEVELVSIAAQ
jgi:FKBP-type peptidyl-prolyl cis-trans isomerase